MLPLFCLILLLLGSSLAVPAQTCRDNIAATTPDREFTVNADGTVTHTRTGLIWDRCAWGLSGTDCAGGTAGEYTWQEALNQAVAANAQRYKGHNDWRLPNKNELASLVERRCYDPAINAIIFPATPSSGFWSSSPNADSSDHAWYVGFYGGYVGYNAKDGAWGVRLVRGGQALVSLPENKPPVAAFSLNPTSGSAPLPVTLDADASTDPEGAPLTYAWTLNGQPFGDNSVQISNTFAPGEYDITLTVTDDKGLSVQATQHLSVTYPPPPRLPVEITLYPDQTQTVTAHSDAPPLTWVSSDPAIAGADAVGTITAHAAGSVSVRVTDLYDQSSYLTVKVSPAPPPDNDSSGLGYAMVIAGGGAHHENQVLFRHTHELATAMYRLLYDRGLGHDEILLLDPQEPDTDGNGQPNPEHRDYLLLNPRSDVEAAFARAAQNLRAGQQFVLYFHGHGERDKLKLNRDTALDGAQLRTLLDSLPADSAQIVILDSCFSGSLLDELAAPHRTVLTAADADSLAWAAEPNSFSRLVINQLRRGHSVGAAFAEAKRVVDNDPQTFGGQNPQLDDDGDGLNTSRDGSRAQALFLLKDAPAQAEAPDIARSHDQIQLPSGTTRGVVWVETYPPRVRKVRAVLTPPDWQAPQYAGENTGLGTLPVLEMGWNAVQEHYEAVYEGFFTPGVWRVHYQAEGEDGLFSDVIPGEVQAAGCEGASVLAATNLSSYRTGSRFRFNVSVCGTRAVDLYTALVFPEGFFMTMTYPYTFNLPNTLAPYLTNLNLTGSEVYPVLDFTLPAGLSPGNYAGCAVLVPAGEVLSLGGGNWLAAGCAGFGVEYQ